MVVDIPFFNGYSFLAHPTLMDAFGVTKIALEIFPEATDGLILYNQQSEGTDFIALALSEGRVVFTYDLGSGVAVLESTLELELGKWHTIEAMRNGQEGQLIVDGSLPVVGSSSGVYTILQLGDNLYFGGSSDISALQLIIPVTSGFTGCIRNVQTGSNILELIEDASFASGVSECLIAPCNVQSCQNGGTCLEIEEGSTCLCPGGYTGPMCETSLCEISDPCQNNGICFVAYSNGTASVQCNCSLPFAMGSTCTESE